MQRTIILILMTLSLPGIPARADTSVSDGNIVMDAKPFFPYGVYFEHAGSKERHVEGFKLIAQAGLNCVFISLDNDKSPEDYVQLYDDAHRLGLHVIAESVDPAEITLLKTHPAVLGWSAGDDTIDKTAEELANRVRFLRMNDPNHLIYASSNGVQRHEDGPRIEHHLDTGVDVMAVQTYPIPVPRPWHFPEEPPHDIRMVFYRARRTTDSFGKKGIPVIVNTQLFKYQYNPGMDRYPTPAELENMTYQAIIAGAKGLIPYTFAFVNQSQPELWQRQAELSKEVKSLAPALMLGEYQRTAVDPAEDWVFSAVWKHQGKAYVAAVNTSYSSIERLNVTIPGLQGGEIKPLFNKPGFTIEGNRLTCELRPLAVHLCEVAIEQTEP